MKIRFALVLTLFFMLLTIRCTKTSSFVETPNPIKEENKIINTPPEMVIPQIKSSRESIVNTNLQDFFLSYDTNVLKSFIYTIESSSSGQSAEDNVQYMINKNVELINILGTINSTSFNPEEINPNDEFVVLVGAFELYSQLTQNISNIYRAQDPWACIGNVILDIIGVGSLYEDYKTLVNSGARWSTIRGMLWSTVKRYAGWAAAANLIYNVFKCLF